MKLTDQDYQDAINVQNACNLSGVVHSFAEVLPRIRETVHNNPDIACHPITVLFASKISDLAGIGSGNFDAYCKASDACESHAGTVHVDPMG